MTVPAPREPHVCAAPYRVRFDECGPDGLLRTSAFLRYAQDLAWYHSARRGFTRAWYAERGLVWLARAAEVAVLGPIRVGDELVGSTRVVGWRRVWARRRTEFSDGVGQLVGWTHVDWVLLDARGAPTRIPPEFDGAFGTPDATFPLARVDPGPTPDDADIATFVVRPQELDPMDHANNAVYADWLDEQVLAAGGEAGKAATRDLPRLVRLEYARPAELGMTVTAGTWQAAEGGWWCRLQDEAGTDLLRAGLGPAEHPG
jgi:acyl-ACP thioesterase